ncbi:Brca1-associated protein, putative [Theobroma cacao]|uniref:Brca1-associated protein, putative n=1 Tax=Theobroma cacao TaxID=3641 RepID=A0A061GNZ4_THECC|nr:Brca1-associated protein, putative [Theobroma cacao]
MSILRVHSVDSEQPITTNEEIEFYTVTSPSNPSPIFSERRGVVHLYRKASQGSLPNPSSRSTSLFVVAVPNYLSAADFIRFSGPHLENITHLLFIRNDGIEDRYSVFIKLVDQLAADGFYRSLNGKRFSPAEAELCHILFTHSVEYTESGDIASTPPVGFTELPTCPICLERLDPDTSGILSTFCDHSFQCSCTSKWTYLSCTVCRFCQQQDEKPACSICGSLENLWVCLICGFMGCGRYKEGHAVRHWKDTQHCYSLELISQQIWDYVGDGYVHRLNQSKADGKSVEMNSRCMSLEGNCGSCGYGDDSGIREAIYSSKVEAIFDEYSRLLATEMEKQRQNYESLLAESKSKRDSSIAEAVEKAVTSEMLDIQNKLDKCTEEKNALAEINRNLIKNQQVWRENVKEIEEREASQLRLKDEKILDLEEQIRDLKVYIEAQKTLIDMTDSDGIRGGTLLPVPQTQSSLANTRRHKKSSRRRN